MTTDEIAHLLDQYRAGIEAELTLLRQLASIASAQQDKTRDGDFPAFHRVSDERDAVMRSLVTLEDGLRVVRQTLSQHRAAAMQIDGFEAVAARHREAAELVSAVIATDQQSLSSMADAELARRAAVASLERGETTLAAYRRVLAPAAASAKLFDRRG